MKKILTFLAIFILLLSLLFANGFLDNFETTISYQNIPTGKKFDRRFTILDTCVSYNFVTSPPISLTYKGVGVDGHKQYNIEEEINEFIRVEIDSVNDWNMRGNYEFTFYFSAHHSDSCFSFTCKERIKVKLDIKGICCPKTLKRLVLDISKDRAILGRNRQLREALPLIYKNRLVSAKLNLS